MTTLGDSIAEVDVYNSYIRVIFVAKLMSITSSANLEKFIRS
jgi:hypothetical protein